MSKQDIASRYASYWDSSDEDDYYAKPKKKSKWDGYDWDTPVSTTRTSAYVPYTQSQFGQQTTNSYWSNFGSAFAGYEDIFEKKEKRMNLQKSIKSLALERGLPVNFNMGVMNEGITKAFSASVNISDERVSELSNSTEKQNKLLDAIERLPMKPNLLQKELFENTMLKGQGIHFKHIGRDFDQTIKDVASYFENGIGSLDEICSRFKPSDETKREEERQKTQLIAGSESQGYVLDRLQYSDASLGKTLAKKIASKFYFPNIVHKEPSIRKGKRINRGFLEEKSNKPLTSRTITAPTKKKLMIIIDGSGSMGNPGNAELSKYSNSYLSSSFSYGLIHSGLFDITHTIIHSETGWANVTNSIKKGELPKYDENGEGFESIDTTLPPSWAKSADYVLFLTDLCIGSYSQEGMKRFLKSNGKHMILSFLQAGTLQGLNVKQVNSFEDMLQGVARLLA